MKQFDDEQIEQQRQIVKDQMNKLNQNVDVPVPKQVVIKKVAIQVEEYDHLRPEGTNVFDLDEPADPVDLSAMAGAGDIQFLFDGRRRRKFSKPKPRIRHREYKVNEFVDSSRVIRGSSAEGSAESQHSKNDIVNSQEAKEII